MAPVNYGIWGKPTSTLDWCEENYIVTQFVAEFWNTISNWIMIIPPLLAAHLSWRKKMEFRIIASYLSVGFVGIGSLGFHCTLIYKMQLMDELPMIYGSCILLYGMLEIKSKENKMNTELTFFFFVISVFTTIMYVIVENPLFFQWSYGILAGSLFGLTFYNCKKYNGSVPLVLLSTLRRMPRWKGGYKIDNQCCLLPGYRKTQQHGYFQDQGEIVPVAFICCSISLQK